VFSSELAQRGIQDIEAVVRQVLSEAAALALDAAVFSTTAAVLGVRPAGILSGVAGQTPSTGGGLTALAQDIGILVGALAAAGGGVNPFFVAAPAQAATAKAHGVGFPIFASAALMQGTIIAVEAGSFVSGFGSVPRFDVSDQAVVHMETSPSALSSVGTPAVIAAPTNSLWQMNCTGVRMIVDACWGLRAAHASFMTGVTW